MHFGAGNIGRGFIGALFSKSGYQVTFVDIAETIINQLKKERKYKIKLATDLREEVLIENVSGLNSMGLENEVIDAIKDASFLTTSIGPNVLPRIALLIAKGSAERVKANDEKLYVIACENQISATDHLKGYVFKYLYEETQCNRIVPLQNNKGSLDVLVEPYYEWVAIYPFFILLYAITM